MPIALRGKWKAMQGKCERGYESANADGVGAEGFAGDGCSQERLSAPWPRFHGVDRADVYIIIRVRACCCGECALNPPPSPPIPRRSPSLAHAQRHALPEHFRSPTQPRRTPAGCAMHARRLRDARPQCAMHSPLPLTTHSPPKTSSRPRTATRPPRALLLPHATPTHARRLRDAFPADRTTHSPHSVTLPPLPFRFGHKKTAPHSACAMPNVSVDRRCGRSFGLVSRALFAAVAGRWRVGMGLRLQPWALRSRRCGRVLRA